MKKRKINQNYLSLNVAILPSIVKGTSLSEEKQTIEFEVTEQLEEGEFFLFVNLDVKEGKVSKISPPLSSLKDLRNTSICDVLLIYKLPFSNSFIVVCFIELKKTGDLEKIKDQIESTYSTIFKKKNFIKLPYKPKFLCFYASQKASPTNKNIKVEIEGKELQLLPLRRHKNKFNIRDAILKLI